MRREQVTTWNDNAEFKDYHAALLLLGFSEKLRLEMYIMYSICLVVGNVLFKEGSGEGCAIKNPDVVKESAELFQAPSTFLHLAQNALAHACTRAHPFAHARAQGVLLACARAHPSMCMRLEMWGRDCYKRWPARVEQGEVRTGGGRNSCDSVVLACLGRSPAARHAWTVIVGGCGRARKGSDLEDDGRRRDRGVY